MDRQYERAVTTGKSASLLESPSVWFNVAGLGGLVAILALALAFMQGMLSPSPNTGMSEMISTKAGGLYVAVSPDDPATGEIDNDAPKVLHEVRNLASARLIAGKPDNPTIVGADVLAEYTRGPQMGIDGAPNNLDTYSSESGSYWGICDWRDTRSNLSLTTSKNLTTTIVAGDVWSGGDVLEKSEAILVRPADEQSQLYILFGNRKAKADANDASMMDALGISAEQISNAQVISRGTLNTIPASPDMLAPNLYNSGNPSEEVTGSNVGDILRTKGADGTLRFHAVLNDGVQAVPEVVANILTNRGGASTETDGATVSGFVQTSTISLEAFPSAAPKLYTPASVCMAWKRGAGSNTPVVRILHSDRLPISSSANDMAVSTLPLAEGSSDVADRVVSKPGKGWFAQVTGNGELGADEHSQLIYISDAGVRFDLLGDDDDPEAEDVRSALGFSDEPVKIPDGVARMLPKGPDLSREAAMVETVGRSDDSPEREDDPGSNTLPEQTRQASPTQSQSMGVDSGDVEERTQEIIDEYGTPEVPPSREPEAPQSGEGATDPGTEPAP